MKTKNALTAPQPSPRQKPGGGCLERLVGLLCWIQCRLGLCGGHIEHMRDENGVWWLGLRCTATGKLHDPIMSKYQDKQPNSVISLCLVHWRVHD